MNFMALFFLCVRMYHFIHAQRLSYLIQNFNRIARQRREHPEQRQIIIIDSSASVFIAYFVLEFLFLLYCIWLMLHEATWGQGFLLLIIAAMESIGVHARISGVYEEDSNGFVYPRSWFRYLTFGESMFILLRLFEG